jgi:glycosyltransferase involved in cell wall biosynthesis
MRALKQTIKSYRRIALNELATLASNFHEADLSIFHEFVPPPAGGGHQFMRAFWVEAEKRGLKVENNTISPQTRACMFNAFNFDETRLRCMHRDSVVYVHRIDGPVGIIRGRDEGIDQHIWKVNHEFANKTILQSKYSLQKHLELGFEFKNPIIVINAPDSTIFFRPEHSEFSLNRKTRLIASSWSDNQKKGADVYTWLDEHLDWRYYEFTFIGNSPVKFKNIRMVAPMPSKELAEQLRDHDIYITASQNDPCSNSLIEALTCGLPAIYLKSGGHPEIVGQGGLGFDAPEEILDLLSKVVQDYKKFQALIDVPEIKDVADIYLKTLELKPTP